MELSIKYFGIIAEITGLEEEKLKIKDQKIGELIDLIINKYPELKGRGVSNCTKQKDC